MPGIYSVNTVTYAATDLISALKNTASDDPFAPLGTENLRYLETFQTYFKSKSHQKPNLRQVKHRLKYQNKSKILPRQIHVCIHKQSPYQQPLHPK